MRATISNPGLKCANIGHVDGKVDRFVASIVKVDLLRGRLEEAEFDRFQHVIPRRKVEIPVALA